MSIGLTNESVISLTEASKILPCRRGGKRPNVTTLYRWTVRGCQGVVLESVQVGGTRCTSTEALDRFFARLTEQVGVNPTAKKPTSDDRAVERADRALEAAGI